jgi:hypothetical protein
MPQGSSLLSLHAGITRLTNKVCLAQRRQTAKGRDYSVMTLEWVAGNKVRQGARGRAYTFDPRLVR